MKTKKVGLALGSIALASAFMSVPVVSYAASTHATSTASVFIKPNGIFRIIGGEVTAISGNVITVVTKFKDSVMNWTVQTNASTTVVANNSLSSSLAAIGIGDRIGVTGKVTTGSTTSIVATKIVDKTSMTAKTRVGTVESVNRTNDSFVFKTEDGKTVTVQTNASTKYKSSSPSMVFGIASLAVGTKVAVTGVLGTNGTTITATSISILPPSIDNKKEWKDQVKETRKEWRDTFTHFGR